MYADLKMEYAEICEEMKVERFPRNELSRLHLSCKLN